VLFVVPCLSFRVVGQLKGNYKLCQRQSSPPHLGTRLLLFLHRHFGFVACLDSVDACLLLLTYSFLHQVLDTHGHLLVALGVWFMAVDGSYLRNCPDIHLSRFLLLLCQEVSIVRTTLHLIRPTSLFSKQMNCYINYC
jgi:hypothetical protein